jgi:hypothetical protein
MIHTVGAIAATAALLGTGAQAASAAPALVTGSGTTNWTQPSGVPYPLAITVTPVSSPPVTYSCNLFQQPNIVQGAFGNAGTPLQGYVDTFRLQSWGYCTSQFSGGAQLVIQQSQRLNAEKSGSTFSLSSPISWKISIQKTGLMVASSADGANVAWSAAFTNGNGTFANPSKVTFTNTLIGNSQWGPMKVTGTLNLQNVTLS